MERTEARLSLSLVLRWPSRLPLWLVLRLPLVVQLLGPHLRLLHLAVLIKPIHPLDLLDVPRDAKARTISRGDVGHHGLAAGRLVERRDGFPQERVV